jgi:hypothetical protein
MSNKLRVKKTVHHTHSFGQGADKMLAQLKDFAKDWEGRQKELVEKHNQMAAQLAAQETLTQQVANFAASEFGKMQAKLNLYFQSIDGALHHHDVNNIALSELLKEVFGQLTQADLFFKKLAAPGGLSLELDEADAASIKRDATSWYEDLVGSAFKVANEMVERQRLEVEEARKAEAERIAAEKQKAADDKSEAERMESEFRKAEGQDRGLVEASGYTEQESLGLPADVRVFGMT